MRWSKNVLPKSSADREVLEYVPTRFDIGTPQQALNYLEEKKHGSDFQMNDVVRVQTGVDKIEKASLEEHIEAKALVKLSEIQETAYKEAYALGLEEGHKKAFETHVSEISEKISELDELIMSVRKIKVDLFTHNEAHLVQMMFHMASRLALAHFENQQGAVVSVLKDAVILAQDEENVSVHVSPSQLDFLEKMRQSGQREFEFMSKVRFQASSDVKPGGCIVETNYGVVDSRIEQRIGQLWETLKENMPVVKTKIENQDPGTK